ncbi:organomercurial lyase [Prauserella muralis]|uniref:Alkylmercury lyase helix-turn-helix domain-containing protein n=1 Tax=Prauserella muralis TaxID=588067 RepID=A0A2V4B1U6_9PSEU|nr:organomercurial lyase [Prauserella muralis]PXY28241.1 hypothetical protein BAY60_18130 [Prauserella muralis]
MDAAHGQPVEEIRRALVTSPDIEYDDQGRIVGAGLTLRPAPHRFDRRVAAQHVVRHGRPRLAIDASGVPSIVRATAVVSLVTPDDLTSVRTAFCNHVQFFASQQPRGRG